MSGYATEWLFKADSKQFEGVNAYGLAQMAQLAYEPEDNINAVLQPWGFEKIKFLDNNGTQAFIASHPDCLIIAFRGTEATKPKDLIADAKVDMKPELSGQVHHGFKDGLDEVWENLLIGLQNYQTQKKRPIWLTGHSLGAALSSLASARLEIAENQAIHGVYNFGSPRLFDKVLSKQVDAALKGKFFRFVNNNDIVTRVPAPFPTLAHLFDWYQHVGQMRYFNEPGDLLESVKRYNWTVFFDRINGRLQDIGEKGLDELTDHSMTNYLRNCSKLT